MAYMTYIYYRLYHIKTEHAYHEKSAATHNFLL